MSHPQHCRGCRGAGHRPGPPIHTTLNGRQHTYTTVKPCEHDHWNDDTSYEPTLAATHPQAIAAHERGRAIGQHELWVQSGGLAGKQHPNHRQEPAA